MPKINPIPPAELLHSRYTYDPVTGVLTKRSSGKPLKKVNGKGYRYVTIDYVLYKAVRVIWKMMTGEDPTMIIDHHNGDRLDDRWVNLRDVSHKVNANNRHGYALSRGRDRKKFRKDGSLNDRDPRAYQVDL